LLGGGDLEVGLVHLVVLDREKKCTRDKILATPMGHGVLFRSSCTIQTSPTDCSADSWRDNFFRKHEHGALWLL